MVKIIIYTFIPVMSISLAERLDLTMNSGPLPATLAIEVTELRLSELQSNNSVLITR